MWYLLSEDFAYKSIRQNHSIHCKISNPHYFSNENNIRWNSGKLRLVDLYSFPNMNIFISFEAFTRLLNYNFGIAVNHSLAFEECFLHLI